MSPPLRLLILGGTTEGRELALSLAGRADIAPVLSLAGRTAAPTLPAIAFRIGGFGGPDGLARYLADERIAAVVDATHPFAARISVHAALACERLALPLVRFSRAPWRPAAGDRWTVVADLAAAADALGPDPTRVFLTIGRLGLAAFRAAPQHDYLVRTIDPPDPETCPPRLQLILERGPFRAEAEAALMERESIAILVTKNSGGPAGKIEAARGLGLPVVMVEPPPAPGPMLTDLAAVTAWIAGHHASPP